MPDERKGQTLLITVVAGAISSVAFGVSVFTWGILWLIPSVKPATPTVAVRTKDKKDRSRRRSAPPILQYSRRKSIPLAVQEPSSPSRSSQQSSPRRVYFLDSQLRPSNQRRYSDLTHLSTQLDDTILPIKPLPALQAIQDDVESSPRSSSSTLVHDPQPQSQPPHESQESLESVSSSRSRPGSSSSSRPSLSLTTCLPNKMRSGWTSKKSSGAGDSGAETQSDDPSSSKPVRRTSLGFTPPWLLGKNRRTTVDLSVTPSESPTTPRPSLTSEFGVLETPSSPSSNLPRTPSITSRKRRTSAPVRQPPPRTQPYAYPYFAAPPTSAQPGESRPSTSSEESVNNKVQTASDDQTEEDRRRSIERRQRNAEAQSSLGHGKVPTHRRTVSEMVAAI